VSTTSTGSSSRRKRRPGPPLARAIEAELRELGIRPSKRFGQSFLADPFVADAEAALVPPGTGEVVEIGGGLATLTEALIRRGIAPLTVIERDPQLAGSLRRKFGDRVRVVQGDALTVDLGRPRCVVGNLPFSVGTPILQRLFELRVPSVVAMVQKEVADRLAAGPGSKAYGRLSILAGLYGEVELFQVVPSEAFVPAPEVDARIFRFTRREDAIPVPSVPDFEIVIQKLFSSRRKQLKNLISAVLPPGVPPDEVLSKIAWPSDWAQRRPEELPPGAYFALACDLHRRRTGPERGGSSGPDPTTDGT
jgi:16S rRNA (adenine1518-N6/adenine1519-N6)-dimethyltransferase